MAGDGGEDQELDYAAADAIEGEEGADAGGFEAEAAAELEGDWFGSVRISFGFCFVSILRRWR